MITLSYEQLRDLQQENKALRGMITLGYEQLQDIQQENKALREEVERARIFIEDLRGVVKVLKGDCDIAYAAAYRAFVLAHKTLDNG